MRLRFYRDCFGFFVENGLGTRERVRRKAWSVIQLPKGETMALVLERHGGT